MVFEPDDHCCAADDCGHCKWLQTKNAIKKKLDHITAAHVRPVKIGHYVTDDMGDSSCSECGEKYLDITKRFCPECGAELRRDEK